MKMNSTGPAKLAGSSTNLNSSAAAAQPVSLPATDVSIEMRLLLACLRWPFTEASRQLVVQAADGPLSWERFLGLVGRHRVHPLVENALRKAGVVPPAAVNEALRLAAAQCSWDELRLAGELKTLLGVMNEAGIKPLVLKGVGLAIRAYGRLGMRYNRDIDLLINYDDVLAACGILEKAGFRRIEPEENIGAAGLDRWLKRQKDIVYQCTERRQIIEIHWRLFDNPHLLPFQDDGAHDKIAVSGKFYVETLPTELDLIFICVHGATHAWSRLKWLADLQAVFAQMTSVELLSLHEAARVRGVHRATAQAMLLCTKLLGLSIPSAVLVDARHDWRIRVLDRLARHSILASGTAEIEDLALGSTSKNISHYLVGNGFRYIMSEAYFDLTDLSADHAALLPSYLVPFSRLYYWIARQARATRRPPVGTRSSGPNQR